MTMISATELARGLADVLNRVYYRGEEFTIERNGQPIAQLTPKIPPTLFTMGDFISLLNRLPRPDADFGGDLEKIRATQSITEAPQWPN